MILVVNPPVTKMMPHSARLILPPRTVCRQELVTMGLNRTGKPLRIAINHRIMIVTANPIKNTLV